MDLSLKRTAGDFSAIAACDDGSTRRDGNALAVGDRRRSMSILLLPDAALAARRAVAEHSLAPLATSLAADLEPLLRRALYFPEDKALLSRDGGRCARDGALLEF